VDTPIPTDETAGLMAAVALSNSALVGFHTGQVSLFASAALLIALVGQARGRPLVAGLALAVASMKPTTLLPFLILFGRKRDLTTWLFMIAGVGLLCWVATPLPELTHRLQEMLARIAYHNAEGGINDYSYANAYRYNILSLDHVVHGLGLRDRRVTAILHLAVLGILGAALAAEILWRRRITRGAACSIVACYSMLFVYHRVYDAILLALPLVYATARARWTRGPARWLFTASIVAIFLVMNVSLQVQSRIQGLTWHLGALGVPIRMFVVPYATWAALAALVCLWLAACIEARDRGASA
jgi:hypothetical protein